MQYRDIKVENENVKRENVTSICIIECKEKYISGQNPEVTETDLKVDWIKSEWNTPRANDLGLSPTQWAFSIWLWFETQVQLFF